MKNIVFNFFQVEKNIIVTRYCYEKFWKKNSQIHLEKSFEIHMSKAFFSRESKRVYNVSHETFLLRLKFFSLVGLKYFLEIFCLEFLQYKLRLLHSSFSPFFIFSLQSNLVFYVYDRKSSHILWNFSDFYIFFSISLKYVKAPYFDLIGGEKLYVDVCNFLCIFRITLIKEIFLTNDYLLS